MSEKEQIPSDKIQEFRATELTTQQLQNYFDNLSKEEQSEFIHKVHDEENPGFLEVAHLSKDVAKYHPQDGRGD